MKSSTTSVFTQNTNRMQAVVHRLQRPYIQGEQLAPGEFLEPWCCSGSIETHGNDHELQIGVYRAISLGTVKGGTLLQKVDSYIRIKLANLLHGYRTH